MDPVSQMFRHLDWANQTLLAALQNAGASGKPLTLFTHLLNAERVWLTRLQGADSSQLPIWSESDAALCAELMRRNAEGFEAFLADAEASDPSRPVSYKDSRGTPFTNSVGDILLQVALHGQYHRGQINMQLRQDGYTPVNVDYIMFVR
ncbi:DinB family protein [Saccharibacillus deserti]|uniref:DinB family protein n=1 Tax=Saccharibacillus deserti TaxID=1634444 RepID=UPI001554871B|nr:DinB family protein [Saccharibacillus deserti]